MTSPVHIFRGRSASPPRFHRASAQAHLDMLHDPQDPATASPSSPTSPHPPPPVDMNQPEKQRELLDPRRSSRTTLASLNPFSSASSSSSRSRSADPSSAAGAGSGSKSFFGRALSRRHKTPADTSSSGGSTTTTTSGQPPPPSAYAEPPIPQVPPPAYTESPAMQNASTAEDPYAFLSTFDTVFLIDDSGSMAGRSWGETRQALASIVPICVAHDTDGVDVYFLNHRTDDAGDPAGTGAAGTGFRHVRSLAAVEALFAAVRPGGATPTGTRLFKILNPYLKHYARRVRETGDETCLKPLNIIVITDGAPSDDPDQVIVNFARKLDDLDAPPYQVGIQFFQVGHEPGAAEKLRQLDDEIANKVAGGVRDMVDTATFDAGTDDRDRVLTGEGILKVVLGSVVKRLDRVESNLRGQSASRSAF